MRTRAIIPLLFFIGVFASARADAEEWLCDSSVINCRTNQGRGLLDLINNEKQAIDVGVWFWKDYRYITALVNAKKRGVAIRIIMDPRANAQYPTNEGALDELAAAGIPMRKRVAGDICHWKLMIFLGQGVVEWSGANFSPAAFVPQVPYKDYEDEVIYFSEQLLPSFMTMFDNIWVNTRDYANYANITGTLVRNHPFSPTDPRLNFPPMNSYQDRLIPLIDREPAVGGLIDVDMFRITMARPVDALIRAATRGVRIRMYLEPNEYINTKRPGNKVQMDRLVAAARQYPGTIEIRMRKHLGLNHQKTVWFHAQRVVVFGTSNWSDASDDNQLEANIFTDKLPGDPLNDFLFAELYRIFERKWYNLAPDGSIETEAWRTPTLPPPTMSDNCLDPKASNYGRPLPCVYPPPPTAPPPPPPGAKTIVIWTSKGAITGSNWQVLPDATAAGGAALWNPNAGRAKVAPALAAPPSYVETEFSAMSGVAYHMWVRLRAQDDSTSNDSVHVQFSDAVTGAGSTTRTMGIGSSSSAEFIIQDGPSAGGSNQWGWADNGWGVPGQPIYFQTTGTHTLRIQAREDGAIVDQIVLSPDTYITNAPGPRASDTTILPETPAESGGSCSYAVSPLTASVAADGNSLTIAVDGTGTCAWSATSNAAWISVSSGGSGTGSGSVSLAVAHNPDTTARTGTVTIAGKTVTVSQQAARPAPGPTCAVTLDRTSIVVGAGEANWIIYVTTPDSTCTWTASADASWLVVKSTSPTAMPVSGNGYVKVRAVTNAGPRRIGHFTVNGMVYTVTQGAGG
jgi:phosphatidylserine/phosphatidylglycerophosphate/cardiolipin synthase-like enzyme